MPTSRRMKLLYNLLLLAQLLIVIIYLVFGIVTGQDDYDKVTGCNETQDKTTCSRSNNYHVISIFFFILAILGVFKQVYSCLFLNNPRTTNSTFKLYISTMIIILNYVTVAFSAASLGVFITMEPFSLDNPFIIMSFVTFIYMFLVLMDTIVFRCDELSNMRQGEEKPVVAGSSRTESASTTHTQSIEEHLSRPSTNYAVLSWPQKVTQI